MSWNLVASAFALMLSGCLLNTPGRISADGGPDGDGDGDTDADSDLPDGCVPEICNYHDDDCDGLIDDGFNLSTDPENCGSCGLVCPPDPPHATTVCVAGQCRIRCETGFRDCNEDEMDGCEADLSSPETCGSCDEACGGENPVCEGDLFSGYHCVEECTEPLTECDGRCVDTDIDTLNCGECGIVCTEGEHGVATCTSGECGFECDDLWGDCDESVDGCETPLTTATNCGACDAVCDLSHADAICPSGDCAIERCQEDWGDCDGEDENGCEEPLGTEEHCGACYDRCREDEECLYGFCVPACPETCTCSDHNCRTSAPCECEPGCPCTDLRCGEDCDVTCRGPDTLCVVNASRKSNFNDFECSGGAVCIVHVTECENFEDRVVCHDAGTECLFTCDTVSNCYPLCVDDATCILECISSDNCEFELCDGVLADCGGGVFVCNGSCP